jgi:hypothetical protein
MLDGIVFGKNTHWPIGGGDWKFKECKELGLEPGNKQPAGSIKKIENK